jgi:hypothetical protein
MHLLTITLPIYACIYAHIHTCIHTYMYTVVEPDNMYNNTYIVKHAHADENAPSFVMKELMWSLLDERYVCMFV